MPTPNPQRSASVELLRAAATDRGHDSDTALLVVGKDGERVYASPGYEAVEREALAAGVPAATLFRALSQDRPKGYQLDLDGPEGSLSFSIERHDLGGDAGPTLILLRPGNAGAPAQREATEAGRRSDRFEDVASMISEVVWETDRDLCLSYVSPRVMDLLGHHPAELAGRPWTEVFGAIPRAMLDEGGLGPGPFSEFETILTHRDGSRRTFRLSGLPVRDDRGSGEVVGFRGTARNVTELLEHETALREAVEAAEAANRIKGEFLANTSHELRTPLNAIIGFSEIMVLERFGPLANERYKAYAQDVLDSAQHLLTLINDILDVAKIEAGKLDLIESDLDPGEVARQTLRLVEARAAREGVALAARVAPGLPRIRADKRKLKQILLNLLSNAVKFTPAGGRVELRAEVDEERGFRFAVTDTGIGIAAEDHATAMAPFGQVDAQLSRRYEGTGLGLPLSSALASLHGGRLILESEPGTGTTVTVLFPPSRVLKAQRKA